MAETGDELAPDAEASSEDTGASSPGLRETPRDAPRETSAEAVPEVGAEPRDPLGTAPEASGGIPVEGAPATAPSQGEAEASAAEESGRHAREPGLRGWWGRRRRGIVRRWSVVGSELSRTRLIVKVFLLHVRYVFGYLAFGFLVSAPLQLGRLHEEGWLGGIGSCLVLGLVCLVPFLVLYPFTRIAWERMRIPEFKNLELALTGWAAIAAAIFVLATGFVRWPLQLEGSVRDFLNPKVAWLCFGLMFFAWVRVKFHTLLFREFYTLRPEDDLVLRVPARARVPLEDPEPEPEPEPEPAPEPPSTSPEDESGPGGRA